MKTAWTKSIRNNGSTDPGIVRDRIRKLRTLHRPAYEGVTQKDERKVLGRGRGTAGSKRGEAHVCPKNSRICPKERNNRKLERKKVKLEKNLGRGKLSVHRKGAGQNLQNQPFRANEKQRSPANKRKGEHKNGNEGAGRQNLTNSRGYSGRRRNLKKQRLRV